MKKLLIALLLTVTTACFAGGPSSSGGIANPLPIANGGTGQTASAAALSALGGAARNGSTTVDFSIATATIGNISSWTYVLAKRSAPSQDDIASAAWVTIIWNSDTDRNLEYDTTTGVFTPNVSGTYIVAAHVLLDSLSTLTSAQICAFVDDVQYGDPVPMVPVSAARYIDLTYTAIVSAAAGQEIDIRVMAQSSAGAITTYNTYGATGLSIVRVH